MAPIKPEVTMSIGTSIGKCHVCGKPVDEWDGFMSMATGLLYCKKHARDNIRFD
jgi:hypothetical protein